MASFEVERTDAGDSGIAIVALAGELDLTNGHALAERLREVSRESRLVLDLSNLVFIDSAGLHHLFRIAEERERGSLAFVVDPTAAVAGTIEIVELDRAAAVVPSLDAARALLSGSTPA